MQLIGRSPTYREGWETTLIANKVTVVEHIDMVAAFMSIEVRQEVTLPTTEGMRPFVPVSFVGLCSVSPCP